MGLSPIEISGKVYGNYIFNNSQYIEKKFDAIDARFEKVENEIKEIRSIVNSIPKWFVGLILSVIGVVVAIFMLQLSNLNQLMDAKSEFLALQSKQADEKFADMMEANDKTYQLILETLGKGN
jgi:hypothetical protein